MSTSGDTYNITGDHRGGMINIKSTIYQHLPPKPVDEATLAAAQARLAALPLDTLPDPAPLPAGSRMPLGRNPLFVGRADDLKALARALKGGTTAAIGQVAAATGLGGIGKTQLAGELVHRYGQFFAGGVFWLNLADAQGVRAEIALCGGPGALNLRPDFGNLPLDDQVRLVLGAWCSPLPRLLVFDNCEDETLLAGWRPPTGGARVLLTSRRGEWSATLGVQTLPLDVLPRPESIALLRRHCPDLSDVDADAIAAELGDLPLALHLAGSFLAAYRRVVTPQDYLTQLRARPLLDHPSLQGRGAAWSPTSHELHVARTFALSYERLNPQNPTDAEALALLRRAACFAPGVSIPRPLLLATLGHPADDLDAALRAEDGLSRLVSLGLLAAGGDEELTLHRLLAAFVRGIDADDAAKSAVEETLLCEANRLNRAGVPAPLLQWQGHLRHITDAALKRLPARANAEECAAGLSNTLGCHLQMIGDYRGARPYYERTLAIYERTFRSDHSHTATSLCNLGTLLQEIGDLAGARPLLERALAIRERALGPDHPDTATSLNNLGALLRSMGDYAAARPLLERALAIKERALGPDHPHTAINLDNLAALLHLMGDLVGARLLHERALAIREQALGPDHPDTAQSLNNLGVLLQAMGDLTGARLYQERALAIREQVLGLNHPHTAISLNNLAELIQAMGDLTVARPLYERALAITERVLGPDHPQTAISLDNLGALLQAMGDYAAARPLYERALAIWERALGPDHLDTATSLNNLGMLLEAMGDYQAARPLLERALDITERALGTNHLHTAINLNNLGMLLQTIGDLAGARPLYERALAIIERVPGSDHPQTAAILDNLGSLLQSMGDLVAARPYRERALVITERIFGTDHSQTAACLNNLGMLLQAMGDLQSARLYCERALAITERILGTDHPQTAACLNNLAILCYYQRQFNDAARLMRRALAICEARLGPNHLNTQQARQSLAAIERQRKRFSEEPPSS